MVKKPKVTTKKLDTLFSKLVRAKGRCSYCGSDQRLQCAHVISRRYHQIRWDLRNAIPLCSSCHLKFTYDPIAWQIYIEQSFGKNHWRDLMEKAQKIGKIDHQEVYEYLIKMEVHIKRLYE